MHFHDDAFNRSDQVDAQWAKHKGMKYQEITRDFPFVVLRVVNYEGYLVSY